MTRDEIDRAIAIIDRHMTEVVAPADTQGVWRMLRAELRRSRRHSERALPIASEAAQHTSLAREHASLASDHAARALAALGGMSTHGPDSVPPPPADDE